jgi:hypothetical protein
MGIPLTPATIAAAICPPGKLQIDLYDGGVAGLVLRVNAGGRKSWNLIHRVNGKKVRLKLGDAALMGVADARSAARQVLGAQSFEALADLFLARASSLRPATLAEYQRTVATELMPRWKTKLVATITRDDIFAVLDPIVARGSKVMANRVQALIVSILNVAVDRGWVQANVARGIRMIGGKEVSRERSLDIRELAKLWRAMDGERPAVAAVLRVLILTCCRRNEVRLMRWEELDMQNGYRGRAGGFLEDDEATV